MRYLWGRHFSNDMLRQWLFLLIPTYLRLHLGFSLITLLMLLTYKKRPCLYIVCRFTVHDLTIDISGQRFLASGLQTSFELHTTCGLSNIILALELETFLKIFPSV